MTITVHTPTNHLANSVVFYKKLNYAVVSARNPTIFTDGLALIEINPDRYARAGIKMYQRTWANEVEVLKKQTLVHETSEGYALNDSNGCWVYLIEKEFKFKQEVAEKNAALTGNFCGISLESADSKKSFEIWKTLGFTIKMGDLNGGFVVLENATGFNVSIMKPLTCPHLFFNPSMTFFNGENNLGIIQQIREANVPIAEEITHFNDKGVVDNIIIRDPGGYGFFIFSD